MGTPARRLPWGPLEEYVTGELRDRGERTLPRDVAAACGFSRANLGDYRRKGVPIDTADRICQKQLGIHPSLIWGEAWWEIPDTNH